MSLKPYGVNKILIVNGHGGNTATLTEVARELREKKGMFVVVFQWWPLAGKLLPEIFSKEERGHAGAEETSLNLFLHPHMVNMGKAVDEQPIQPISQFEGLNLPLDTADYTRSGVFGKSSTADAEKGRKIFETVVEELVRFVNKLRRIKPETLSPRESI